MTRISLKEDPKLQERVIRIETTLKNGTKLSDEYTPKGDAKNPLTQQDLNDKFKKCARFSAYQVSDEVVEMVHNALLNLEEIDDVVNSLLLPFTPH